MSKIIITGGTGLVGKALTGLLISKGHQITILSRTEPSKAVNAVPGVQYAQWDVSKQTIDINVFRDADFIIHLAGEGVADKRWSNKRKNEIRESRTKSCELIVKTLRENPNNIKAVICASAIGWYGADPAVPNIKPFIEIDPNEEDFLGVTCKLWEDSIGPVAELGKRLVIIRTGIVLSAKAGAFKEFMKPAKFGIATILGSGKQIISWLHIEDLCRIYLQAIENETLTGAYNAVAPKPVTNRELIIQTARTIKGHFFIPFYVPSFILKVMLGEMSTEVLKSTTVSAEKIRKTGFNFIFPSIESAVSDLLRKT